ncbi:metalloprotease PmbA [Usitatibacter palustris]|uniref:Metalloprotease PmbA n=1 Tax=Usitatibacter palustris TaxID=2732487 RepID=A0A6M4H4Y3_9PROT|nr:metalloprotease PmbA [Usitatibacter palustris]QJR14709.1 Metalloprotease PmbA [Usitatibacter palustris]
MPDTNLASAALPLSRDAMAQTARRSLEIAKACGASDAEAEISAAVGQSVTVRRGEVETVEYNRDKGLGITVFFGTRRGNASTSDLSDDAIRRTVEAACAIARHTAADEFAGLPDVDRLWKGEAPDLGLFHPWGLSVEASIEIARETEAAALAVDKRITNTEGATVSAHDADFILANSRGFFGGYPTSRASIGVSVIAEDKAGMQRDYWYTSHRDFKQLERGPDVGRVSGQRAVSRLGSRRLPTGDVPVLFDANISGSLLGSFVGAASGSSLYRRSSFLLDKLDTAIFAPHVQILEDPHQHGEMASAYFDGEGVSTVKRNVVEDGVLKGWFLSTYSSRKLGLPTTGNAGGNHNLVLAPGEHDQAGLLKLMGRGLLVTELLGQGVNPVTGDYSRGAAGFWVEGGEIKYPVEEVTIAGNLLDMYRGIVACGRDVLVRGSKQCGSILVDRMTIAGE